MNGHEFVTSAHEFNTEYDFLADKCGRAFLVLLDNDIAVRVSREPVPEPGSHLFGRVPMAPVDSLWWREQEPWKYITYL